MRPDGVRFAKVLVFANALVPLGITVADAARGRLGANPVEFVLHATGTMALVFLTLTLMVTPARKLLGLPALGKLRRMLGLFAFFYGSLHFLTYLWLDQFFDLGAVVQDVVGRPFVAVGMLSFLLMVPLAVTSTNAMVRRLGGKRWTRLHKRVYWVAVGAIVHYWLLVKADLKKPLFFGAVMAVLLGYRLLAARKPRELPTSLPSRRSSAR